MTTTIEYQAPTNLVELCRLLESLDRADEVTQSQVLRNLTEDVKPLFAMVRRAAFVRSTLREGSSRRAQTILGVGPRNVYKTCSEARSELQQTLRLLGGGWDPTLLEPGTPFGPLARAVQTAYAEESAQVPGEHRYKVALAHELASLILGVSNNQTETEGSTPQ